ncbi:hypothetical protein MLD38_007833 [Melastoma candidum]|uniref:Uncharacterized protein n=1 Tax=Melastoma candidum TaxID=119954 RepID=A0ACB9RSC0_9MYRT|nr:hypothetical protein MLD38_007833 [Melastoma candidum]
MVVLETELCCVQERGAPGAGVGFVAFKGVYTVNKAVKGFWNEERRTERFFSVMELRLQRNQWKVEWAPLATDIDWNHLGLTKLLMRCKRVAASVFLLLILHFFSSSLALLSALKGAARISFGQCTDLAEMCPELKLVCFPCFPVLAKCDCLPQDVHHRPGCSSLLSSFEKHMTVSGEKRAALIRLACFFLINLMPLRGLVF